MDRQPLTLLIVEDEEAHAELIRRAFESQSRWASLVITRSLQEARTHIAQEKPGLVIADFRLPDGIGTELLLAGTEELSYPVVIMTGHGAEQLAVEAMKAGALDYVVKSAETLADMPHVAERALREWEHLTQRKRTEEALQTLSRQLLEIQESERRHIAHELHDEIGQALSLLKIYLQNARETGEIAKLKNGLEIIDHVLRQVRDLSLDLRPSLLDDFGLVEALEWYVGRQIQQVGIEVQFDVTPLDPRPAPHIETACFRVAQEALTNVIRYAQAQKVLIEIRPDRGDRSLHLLIQDNGVGFDVRAAQEQAVHGASAGLLGMQERIGFVGGTISIESIAQHGTTIRVHVPLN